MSNADLALDSQFCFSLYRASRLITRTYQTLLADLGLTYPQYLVMLVLWESQEPVGMKELSLRLDLDSGTLTPLLKRLIALELITKEKDATDERRAVLRLTRKGDQLKEKAGGVPRELKYFCTTSGLNLDQLKSDLDALVAELKTYE